MSRISSRKAKYYYDEPFAEAAARQKQRNTRRYFEASFHCRHCGALVNSDPLISGVNNRNHCPYCLHSRHLDLYESGDRLCACRGTMQPIGLTAKHNRNKYASLPGEMMLVHQCLECSAFSINRIAADDTVHLLLDCYQGSLVIDGELNALLMERGIQLLQEQHRELIFIRLLGEAGSYLLR